MNDILLFKYRPISQYLIKGLEDSTIYFALPEKLNDPFDCQVNIAKCLYGAIKESNGRTKKYLEALTRIPHFSENLQNALLNVGICSFTKTLENPLLWAHYADNHRGVCLLYKFPEAFFADERKKMIGLAVTDYGDSPLRKWFKNVAPTLGKPGCTEMGVALSKKLFTVKGKCWDYEQEVRAIRELPGPVEIPRSYLTQICFGLRTSEADVDEIRKVTSGDNVFFCKIVHDDTDFGIKAIKI
jgi:hypothetical protein